MQDRDILTIENQRERQKVYFPQYNKMYVGLTGIIMAYQMAATAVTLNDLEAVSYTHLTLPTNREV